MQHYIFLEHLEVAGVRCRDDPRQRNYVELTNRLQPYHSPRTVGVWAVSQPEERSLVRRVIYCDLAYGSLH